MLNYPIVRMSFGEGIPSELHSETPTRYFVIIRRLRPGAAALHHLLPPLLHDAVQVGEDLQRTYRKTDNGYHTQGERCRDMGAESFYGGFLSEHMNTEREAEAAAAPTRGRDGGQSILKLFSQEEGTELLHVLSTWSKANISTPGDTKGGEAANSGMLISKRSCITVAFTFNIYSAFSALSKENIYLLVSELYASAIWQKHKTQSSRHFVFDRSGYVRLSSLNTTAY